MRKLALCFILAGLAWSAEPAPVKKPRRITGIFRKLAAAEVEGAIRLSGWGIPDPDRPPQPKKGAATAAVSPPARGRT